MTDANCDDEYELAEPRADAMIQSLRAFGYDLATAIADLIDNSISAGARNVWIKFFWDGGHSSIALIDDGSGMSETQLQDAMRPGSRNPLEERDPKDLGRFGLGLKTASFSQAKSLTVGTKQDGKISVRRWDLDYVTAAREWRLLKHGSAAFHEQGLRCLEALSSGTIVFWDMLDRLIASNIDANDGRAQAQFYERMDRVSAHLSTVFHRYLKPEPGQKGVKIWIQNREVKAWDPFLTSEPATRRLCEESLRLFGDTMTVQAYVLPHISKIKPEVHQRAAGLKGWNAQQGFYVYRSRRLLVAGSWLGLKDLRQEEHYKLARILVDIPNHLDTQWEIDVKKSRAYPPTAIRDPLTAMAVATRAEAAKVYRQRGARLQSVTERKIVMLWESISKNNRLRYRLNRDHPVVKAAQGTGGEAVEELLRFVEETVPVASIPPTGDEETMVPAGPFEGQEQAELLQALRKIYGKFVTAGVTPDDARRTLASMDPFHRFPALIGMLEEENKDDSTR
jgi:hypothetical protein